MYQVIFKSALVCAMALLSGCGLFERELHVSTYELCVAEPNPWGRDLLSKGGILPGTTLEVDVRDYEDGEPCASRPLASWGRVKSSAPEALRVTELGSGRLRLEALAPGAASITIDDADGEEVLARRVVVAEPTAAYWENSALDLGQDGHRVVQDADVWLAYRLASEDAPGASFYGEDRPDSWQVSPPEAATVQALAPAPHHFEGGERLVHVVVHAQPGEAFTLQHKLGFLTRFEVVPDAEIATVRATMHTDYRTTPDTPEVISRPVKHRDAADPSRYRLQGGLVAHLYDRQGRPLLGRVDTRWMVLEGQDNLRLVTDAEGWQDRDDPPGKALTGARPGEGVIQVEARGVSARVRVVATEWP